MLLNLQVQCFFFGLFIQTSPDPDQSVRQAHPIPATKGGLSPRDRTPLLHICMQSQLDALDREWKVLRSSKLTAIRGHANVARCNKSQTNFWDLYWQ